MVPACVAAPRAPEVECRGSPRPPLLAEGPPASVAGLGGRWPLALQAGLVLGRNPFGGSLAPRRLELRVPEDGLSWAARPQGAVEEQGAFLALQFCFKNCTWSWVFTAPGPQLPSPPTRLNLFTVQAPAVSPWECYISFARPWLGSQASAAGISPGDSFLWTSRPMLVPSPRHCLPGARGESKSSDVIRCYEFIYLYIYIYNLLRFYEMAFAVDLTLLTQCLCRLPARGGGPPERGTFCTV